MGILSQAARGGIRKASRRPDLPEWWSAMQITVAAACILFVIIELMGSGGPGKHAKSVPSSYVPIASLNKTPAMSAPVTNKVAVPLFGMPGKQVSIDGAAVASAKLSAAAIFTGNTKGITASQGSVFPLPATPVTTANVLGISSISSSATKQVFLVNVDLADGLGSRPVTITLIKQGGLWCYAPSV